MFELTQFISNTRGNDLIILCGDFNTTDNHPAYRLITTYLGLQVQWNLSNLDTAGTEKENVFTSEVS